MTDQNGNSSTSNNPLHGIGTYDPFENYLRGPFYVEQRKLRMLYATMAGLAAAIEYSDTNRQVKCLKIITGLLKEIGLLTERKARKIIAISNIAVAKLDPKFWEDPEAENNEDDNAVANEDPNTDE